MSLGADLRCGRNKVSIVICCNGLFLCAHKGIEAKHYALTDLSVHGEKIEPSDVFCSLLQL